MIRPPFYGHPHTMAAGKIHWPNTSKMKNAKGPWLGDRPLCRLFRIHVDVLPCLAPAVRGREAVLAFAVLLEGLQL